ncbi:MAG: 16S rRNA processing protein RimM [Nitriliruptoraceae bacterium]|nr:16S rRNA processing protein RimM [Nitriliruptoraceae bacterium]
MGDDAELVVIGRIVKPHGIRGELAVDPLSDVSGRFDTGTEVVVGTTPRVIASARAHQGRVLVTFEGIGDRTAAELLRGQVLRAAPVDIEDSEHYFAHELVGLSVRAEDGRELGTVSALIELPPAAGYDLLEVTRADGSSWLLPDVDEHVEVVVDADEQASLLVVDPPEGLIDGEAENAAPDADGATS